MMPVRVLLACLLVPALAPSSGADTLRLADRSKMEGALQEILLRVNGLPRMYSRGDVKAAELSADSGDMLELADGSKVEGQVLSITFRAADKLYALGRTRVRSVALDARAAPEPAEPPVATVAAEPVKRARPLTTEELEAQKKALAKNEQFCRDFAAKARKRGLFGSAGKADARHKQVLAMAEQIKSDLLAGRYYTDGQMFVRYEAALAGKPYHEPVKVQLRTMSSGVKVIPGSSKDTPELIVEPFPEMKY